MAEAQPVSGTRGKRALFVRIPLPLYSKLRRLTAAKMALGKPATIQETVVELIEKAREKK